jgi:putative mRNA 3-end processing factor
MSIEGKFLGGGQEVGRLAILLKHAKSKLLFDYGMTASRPPVYPAAAPPVDKMFLTHSHLDHCGMVPWLTARYDIDVVATPVSREVGLILMDDCIKVGKSEGYPEYYTPGDVNMASRRFRTIDFLDTVSVNGTQVQAHPAGHIPGATMYEIQGNESTLVTGDLHTIDTRLVKGAKPVKCDNLVMEATYAGREHTDRQKTEHAFLKKVDEVVERGGMVIVPSFAVGRTQEMILLLKDSQHEFWLDGMGRKVNKVYSSFPEFVRSPKKLRHAMSRTSEIKGWRSRPRAMKGDVIVTTSGMLDGGPVVDYINQIRDDPRSAILLTGYQVEGCNGRRLMETGTMEFQGVVNKVECEVMKFDFSAHAGHTELMQFAKGCDPEKIVLCHGDQRDLLADDLKAEGYEVLMPMNGEDFTL